MEEEKTHKEEHHETHHVHKTKSKKKVNYWKYSSLVLVILLIASVYFDVGSLREPSSEEAGNEIMTFINDVMVQPGMTAELKNIEDAQGVYKIDLDIEGQEFTSYITKDAEIFFPQGFVVAELKEELGAAEESTGATGAATTTATKSDKPNIKMFVMTYCPYGQQAEAGLYPALELLGDTVEFEPHFIFYSNYCGWGIKCTDEPEERVNYCYDADEEEPQYCSMHGINELNEGVRQLCIDTEYPDKWWDYVNKINAECSLNEIETCWQDVAEEVGIDVAAIEDCFDTKIELLLKKEVLLKEQYGASGSPTIIINDGPYGGGRAAENYKQALCDAFNEAPAVCGEALSTTGGAAEGSC
ncbi:DsbA family protein [Nanoarchaeota archaeon]